MAWPVIFSAQHFFKWKYKHTMWVLLRLAFLKCQCGGISKQRTPGSFALTAWDDDGDGLQTTLKYL